MSSPPPSTATHSAAGARAIGLAWLLRLRTASVVGVLVIVLVASLGLRVLLPLGPLLGLLAAWFATNTLAILYTRRRAEVSDAALAGLLALDAVFLAGVFYLTGGPSNPFSFFFLVHLSLAAIALPARWAWALAGLSTALFGLLFLDHVPLTRYPAGHEGHEGHAVHDMELHLRGMWFAFAAAATYILTFTTRLGTALVAWQADLADARAQAAKGERLASLATLAAGAAHELSTPLSTIAVVAGELERSLEGADVPDDVRDDVRLVRSQVDRCRAILEQLRVQAGDPAGEAAVAVDPAALVGAALANLPAPERVVVSVAPELAGARPTLFAGSLSQALTGIVRNALDASPQGAPIHLDVVPEGEGLAIGVHDRGVGMAPEVAERVGEPFFTTKGARGMGLGVFLARAIAEQHGGRLSILPRPDGGTSVVFHLPSTPRTA